MASSVPPAVTGLLVVLLLVVPDTSCQPDTWLAISPPDIYPLADSFFHGEVTVQLVSNARGASLFYTIDGSNPTNRSMYYQDPIRLFTPGNHTVKAIAISNTARRGDSVVVNQTYTILPGDIHPPVPTPGVGRYRGTITVALAPYEDFTATQAGAKIQYILDVNDLTNQTWLDYDKPIKLDTPGVRTIFARVLLSDKSRSAHAKFVYTLTPPLVYDISTECADCKGPTAGEFFTVWVQGAKRDSRMFLTITATGCNNHNHLLDDTRDDVPIGNHRPAARFRTFSETPTVYVCLSEGNAAHEKIARRIPKTASGADTDTYSFSVAAPIRQVSRPTLAPGATRSSAPGAADDHAVDFGRHGSGSSFAMVMLYSGVIGLLIYVVRLMRKQPHHRTAPVASNAGREVGEDDEMR